MAALKTTELADGRIELSGGTFPLRDQIKARGGKWDPTRKIWTLPAGTSLEFEAPPEEKAPAVGGAGAAPKPKPKPRAEWTREEWQAWSRAYSIRNRGRVERCCEHAAWVGDPYGPMEYSCPRHGETKGSYRGD
jgi:hypothetical protein